MLQTSGLLKSLVFVFEVVIPQLRAQSVAMGSPQDHPTLRILNQVSN
jgi:hypothetical protein